MDDGATDPGVARAGTAVAARREELGISQRELARRKVLTAPALSAFERGRAWPREKTRHTLEELLQWPAGTIARIRQGAPLPAADHAGPVDDEGVSVVAETLGLALARFDDAIDELPAPSDVAFASRATSILLDLRKLERLAARAVRHTQGSPAVIKVLSTVRRRYDELMSQAANSPGASPGQRLYAARRHANLTVAEAAAALGATADLVEAVESGEPIDAQTARRVAALIEQWTN